MKIYYLLSIISVDTSNASKIIFSAMEITHLILMLPIPTVTIIVSSDLPVLVHVLFKAKDV